MATHERTRLEAIYEMARQLAAELAPMTRHASEAESLSLRLAQAHALGLVDQLAEIMAPPAARPSAPPPAMHATHADKTRFHSH